MKKKKEIDFLQNKKVKFIYRIIVKEEDIDYNLADTFLLKLDDDSLVQILIDYEVLIYELFSTDDILILGDYDIDECITRLVLVKEIHDNLEITSIYSYFQSTYHFGSKFLDSNNNYIFGFCFGWDEIELISEDVFVKMLESYDEKAEIKIC